MTAEVPLNFELSTLSTLSAEVPLSSGLSTRAVDLQGQSKAALQLPSETSSLKPQAVPPEAPKLASALVDENEDAGEDMDISDSEAPARDASLAEGIGSSAPATTAAAEASASEAAVPPAARRRNFGSGTFGSGRVRRLGAAAAASAAAPTAAQDSPAGADADASAGGLPALQLSTSSAAVQSSVWLRLGLLMPLLPIVHADREADARRNLKAQLVPALAWLLLSPVTQPLAPLGSPSATASSSSAEGHVGMVRHAEESDPDLDLALRAQTAAGETLRDRLAAVLSTLLAGNYRPPPSLSIL